MAEFAIFASGSGSNFESIVEAFKDTTHRTCCLICDRRKAPVFERAKRLGVEAYYVPYFKRERSESEMDIRHILAKYDPKLLVLAGYMRIFTREFIDTFPDTIVNVHPALLPAHPGTHGITDSYGSMDEHLGITIHYVDSGVDTGPIIRQESFQRKKNASLDEVESRIHALEHRVYPEVIRSILEGNTIGKETM